VETLRSGRANPMELVLRRHITREADEYTTNSVSAVVAKMVEAIGVHIAPGESIEFIILDQSGKRKPEKAKPLALYAFEDGYDIDTYVLFALKAIETLLLPFGYTLERLREIFSLTEKKQSLPKKPAPMTGDLFQ
jgi:DNA polymerase elongation subunit (family B)